MSTTTTKTLADELAAQLAELRSSTADALARVTKRRRTDVLRALDDDPRFVRRGLGRWTRWELVPELDGDGYGTDSTALAGPQAGSDTPVAAESLSASRCTEPERHAGNRAHWRDEEGVTWCVVCDVMDIQPLTFEEWLEGRGGQDERDRFEADWAAFNRDETTPEQIERLRLAFGVVV